MIICYLMANKSLYKPGFHNQVECCGEFRDLDEFQAYKRNEEYYNRYILSFWSVK